MKFPKIKLAQKILQYCKSFGVKHIVISPGSRNAPLTMGFYEDPFFSCYSIVDERCAGFFAMGMAQKSRHPVALVCTSGSALLNYYPAIAEAYYSDIPLVVISADRPSEKIDIGDGQTIRQTNVFVNHSLFNANLTDADEEFQKNEDLIQKALKNCIIKKGPVHINAPFEEPLYEMIEGALPLLEPPVFQSINEGLDTDTQFKNFTKAWNTYQKKLIIVGVLHPDEINNRVLEFLSEDSSVIVFTETTSNLPQAEFFAAIDQLIAPIEKYGDEIGVLQPEMLITFGGMVISKKIKAFLRKYPPKLHYHIDEKKAYDTYFSLTHHFKTSADEFFETLMRQVTPQVSHYKQYWKKVKQHRRERHAAYLKEIPYSDFWVYHKLFNSLPTNCVLQLSNSSTVRYTQLFDIHASLKVYCNRGTSGIDGSTSTAIGAANATDFPVLLVTGDLSFFYDSNALWNDYIPHNFKIVLINNGGGGIFRILPGPKHSKNFHKYFETRHHLKASYLCEMYGISYFSADNRSEFQSELSKFLSCNVGPSLIEIFTPTDINDEILLDYFKFIR